MTTTPNEPPPNEPNENSDGPDVNDVLESDHHDDASAGDGPDGGRPDDDVASGLSEG